MTGIVRSPRPESGYFLAFNSTARDGRLSFRARGLLFRLLSNEDGYRTTATTLAEESKEGRAAILAALLELRSYGYALVRKFQDERGRWRTETAIFDLPQQPTDEPKFENRTSVHRTPVNRHPETEPLKKNHKNNNEKPPPPPPSSGEEGGGGGVELDELLTAAEWAASQTGNPPRFPVSWRREVRRRLRLEGPNEDDMAALVAWRKATQKVHPPPPPARDPRAGEKARAALKAAGFR